MPARAVCRVVNENDHKISQLLHNYVMAAREYEDFSQLNTIGIDETSRAKGHKYVSLFVDLKQSRTVFVVEGKDHNTKKQFAEDLIQHNGDPIVIKDVSCDITPAFIKGVRELVWTNILENRVNSTLERPVQKQSFSSSHFPLFDRQK